MNVKAPHKNLRLLLLSFFCMMQMCCVSQVSAKDYKGGIPPFALITIPKSGSHLAMKALQAITGATPLWHTKFPSLYCIPGNEGYLYTHFCVSPGLEDDYRHLPEMRKIVMVRDLRDVCVSMVHQIRKDSWPGLSRAQRQEFLTWSFDKQLFFVIDFEYDTYAVSSFAPDSLQVSLSRVARQALAYTQDPLNFVCRYENLVGPMGGGSLDAQVAELKNMAKYLDISMTDEQCYAIAPSLYGDEVNFFGQGALKNFRSTFMRGQIGHWANVFTEEHKLAFKEKLGQVLIDLGYEEDHNW